MAAKESPFAGIDDAVAVVTNSVEFKRIKALPRRVLDLRMIRDATFIVRRKGGTMTLFPVQSAALIEAAIQDGLFAPIGVGHGKTLITLLLPYAMASKRSVLLVPPRLKKKTLREIDEIYQKHFELRLEGVKVVAYSELSSAGSANVLEDHEPDLIIADECHALTHSTAARTKRFLRYMREHPSCRFVGLSGTITQRSIMDYAHLAELALRKNSPLPGGYRELKDWAGALDVNPEYRSRPGVLRQFCEVGESTRSGFRRRLVETPGVVATEETELGTSLTVRRLVTDVPEEIDELLEEVRRSWSIEGEQFESAVERGRVLRQIATGFYYRWDWPDGIVDHEWLIARSNWRKEVREILKHSRRGLDSPLLVARAAAAGRIHTEHWAAWARVMNRPEPPTVPVWVSDFLIDAAIRWGRKALLDGNVLLWYRHKTLGERLAQKSGWPHYGAGTDADEAPSDQRILICSVASQGEGKNLQRFSQNLLTSMPTNGKVIEQLMGRTHRHGQQAPEVVVDWFGHTDETEQALASVLEDAQYVQETTGQRQRILYADRVVEPEEI